MTWVAVLNLSGYAIAMETRRAIDAEGGVVAKEAR
jgi:hypothetical protein